MATPNDLIDLLQAMKGHLQRSAVPFLPGPGRPAVAHIHDLTRAVDTLQALSLQDLQHFDPDAARRLMDRLAPIEARLQRADPRALPELLSVMAQEIATLEVGLQTFRGGGAQKWP